MLYEVITAMLGYEELELTGAGYQTYEPGTDLTTYVKGQNYWELKDGFRVRNNFV